MEKKKKEQRKYDRLTVSRAFPKNYFNSHRKRLDSIKHHISVLGNLLPHTPFSYGQNATLAFEPQLKCFLTCVN